MYSPILYLRFKGDPVRLNTYNEFACIKEMIRLVNLNVAAATEHVGEIEKLARAAKEGTQRHVYRCLHEKDLRMMIVVCVVKITKDLNQILWSIEYPLQPAQIH